MQVAEFLDKLDAINIVDTANLELIRRNRALEKEIERLTMVKKDLEKMLIELNKDVVLLKIDSKLLQKKLFGIAEILNME